MTETMPFDFAATPDEIPLAQAPLVRVLCQARFSPVPELLDDAVERALAEKLPGYPVRGQTNGLLVGFGPGVAAAPAVERLRVFEDEEGRWKVTVGQDFVALETNAYERRDGFIERMRSVLSALSEVKRPPRVSRIGMRYVDRIEQPHGLVDLVRPPLLGWLGHLSDAEEAMEHQIVQVQLKVPNSTNRVQVRSLFLPPGVMVDPAIPPVGTQSWWLDIDAFDETPTRFEPGDIAATVASLAQHAYSIFHWSVTDDFRRKFGAQTERAEV